jgi:hypothetical protein
MKYNIVQWVTIVDMNDEIIAKVLFNHGEIDKPLISLGCTVISYQLGLKQFEVVHDRREGKIGRFTVTEVEINMISQPTALNVYLEPQELIVGQHDVGENSL